MRIFDVLRDKGHKVVGLAAQSSIQAAILLMKSHGIGAVVVQDDEQRLLGIVSERDIVLGLAERGAALLERPVSELMVTDGPVASLDDSVPHIMKIMTQRRARHLPVVAAGVVVGVVSIGDIIKSRLAEKIEENAVLQDLARLRLATA